MVTTATMVTKDGHNGNSLRIETQNYELFKKQKSIIFLCVVHATK